MTTRKSNIHITEHHHEVLPHWVEAFKLAGEPLVLITFDYHTDLHPAFIGYGSVHARNNDTMAIAQNRLRKVDIGSEISVTQAVTDLRHDEHIDCALELGILSHAYVFVGRHLQEYPKPGATVFNLPSCIPGCSKTLHDEDCDSLKADCVIEDWYISPEIQKIKTAHNLPSSPFILDIDLDVFNTAKSLSPESNITLTWLAQHAYTITVARERRCFENLKLESDLLLEFVENRLLALIA